MADYKIVNNYIIFEELDPDSLGGSFRVGEIKDKKVIKHSLLTDVYPLLLDPPNVWRRIHALIEGIRNQNIPGLLHPEQIVEEGDKALLVYPFINGKSLEKVIEDAAQSNTAIELELIFAIVFEIADVLDNSSAIIVNKKRTFHGVLTPDNIILDYDGKVSLKNYGIFPYLRNASQLLTETIKKFNPLLAPELTRNETLTVQSDIYHLGNIIFRLLTGNYFQHSPGQDFESQMSEIDLEQHIFLPEEGFEPKISELFKRTLNPDPDKRFATIKEFKEYVSNNFNIEELSSATFMLAYFMNLLYKKTIEETEKLLEVELAYTVPEIKPVVREPRPVVKAKVDDHMIEDLLIELEQQKRSKVKIIVPFVIILIAVIAVATYLFLSQQQEARKQQEAQMQRAQEFEQRVAQMKAELTAEYQKRLKSIEQQAATTEEEKKAQADEIDRLKKWRQDQEEFQQRVIQLRKEEERKRREQEREKKQVAAMKTQTPKQPVVEQKPEVKPAADEVKTAAPETIQPKDIPQPKVLKVGDTLPLESVTFSPSKMSGTRKLQAKDLGLPDHVLQKYSGQNLTIESDILVTEFGSVSETKVKGNLPRELQSTASDILQSWTYIPAEKDKVKVKVWIPAELTIAFEGELPGKTEVATPKPQPTTTTTTTTTTPTTTAPPQPAPIVSLESTTYKPSKMSGQGKLSADELKLSQNTTNQFKGRTLSINATILINESGNVTKVNIKGDWPSEIKAKVEEVMKSWTYVPAERNKAKVQVWLPAQLTIAFAGTAPVEKLDTSKLTNIVPVSSLTFRPSKLSGKRKLEADDLNIPKTVKRKYKGQTLTISSDILLDEGGRVITAKVKGDYPDELKTELTQFLMTWQYIPAEKDKKKVKVWFPVQVTVSF